MRSLAPAKPREAGERARERGRNTAGGAEHGFGPATTVPLAAEFA
jgi:hypothetical protein